VEDRHGEDDDKDSKETFETDGLLFAAIAVSPCLKLQSSDNSYKRLYGVYSENLLLDDLYRISQRVSSGTMCRHEGYSQIAMR
jgi:hypothetical protein